MRISDWSSDVCSSDLETRLVLFIACAQGRVIDDRIDLELGTLEFDILDRYLFIGKKHVVVGFVPGPQLVLARRAVIDRGRRSEEHRSELQSLMRISYAVFCLKQKKANKKICKTKSIMSKQKKQYLY